MWTSSGQYTTGAPPNEESGPLAENTPLTGYEPKLPYDFHHSETTEIIFQEQSSDAVPSYLLDAELDDETIGRSLYSPLFTQDREEPAGQRQAHHSFEEKFVASSVLFHTHKNGETRARTWFAKFVQTKTKSRNGKRTNQDSP